MSIIDIKLSGRLEGMIKEVEKEYNLSAGEIIANSLDHFIKDKKHVLDLIMIEIEVENQMIRDRANAQARARRQS